MSISEYQIKPDSAKNTKCKKCDKNIINVELQKEYVKDPQFKFRNLEKQGDSYVEHYLYCFPKGFRFNYGDKILYKPYNNGEEKIYEVIGIDRRAYKYIIQNIAEINERNSNCLIYWTDKNAIKLDEAGEALFT